MNNQTGLHVLIRRIAQGDTNAQSELGKLVRTPLTNKITTDFGSSFSEDDITDVVLQSILHIFLNATNYRGDYGESSAWRWVYKIARNQALKWLKTTRHEIHFPDASDDTDIADARVHKMITQFNPSLTPDSLEEQLMEKLFQENAQKIIQQLSERERLILYLYSEKKWTFKQIAKHLNVSPARITQIMQDIRRKCQSAAF